MSEEHNKIKMAIESEQQRASKFEQENILLNQNVQQQSDSDSLNQVDDIFAELSQDWQAQPVPKTDIAALLKQTRKRTLWAKSCFGLNIIATLCIIIGFFYGVVIGEFGQAWNIYLGLGGVLSVIFVYFETQIRLKTWSQLCDSPDKAIDNAIAGCQSSMKYMWLTKWSCLPFGLLANWFIYAIDAQSEDKRLVGFIFINIFIAAMYLITELIHRKRKKEYQQLLTLKEE